MNYRPEIAWLIEKTDTDNPGCTTGACLGAEPRGKLQDRFYTVWTSPDLALRFARKEDAELAAKAFNLAEPTVAVEHSWSR